MRVPAFLPFLAVAEAIVLHPATGSYSVATQVHSMTDNSRTDPYAPKSNQHKRKLVTSVFWPIEDSSLCVQEEAAYMPPATAAFYGQQVAAMGLSNDTFSELRFEVCSVSSAEACRAKNHAYPLALFSPGSGNSRLLYGAMAQSLASRGYVVVTVDHPYDAGIVEFPDGSIITSANISEETGPLEKLTKVRAADLKFVISTLEKSPSLFKGLPGKVDFDRIVAWGHSLGGASAAAVMLNDARVRGGVDLDGRIIEPALSQGLRKPFMLLGRPSHRSEDETWPQFWKQLRGSKVEAAINGTVHGSYMDVPLIVNALGLPDSVKAQIASMIGTIDAERLSSVLTEALASFFTFVFEGKTAPLRNAAAKMDEFSILRSNL